MSSNSVCNYYHTREKVGLIFTVIQLYGQLRTVGLHSVLLTFFMNKWNVLVITGSKLITSKNCVSFKNSYSLYKLPSWGLISLKTVEPWFNEPLYNIYSSVKQMIFLTLAIVNCREKPWYNDPCYSEHVFPDPWSFVISGFHCIGLFFTSLLPPPHPPHNFWVDSKSKWPYVPKDTKKFEWVWPANLAIHAQVYLKSGPIFCPWYFTTALPC